MLLQSYVDFLDHHFGTKQYKLSEL